MSDADSKHVSLSELVVSREVAERVEFESHDPEHQSGELWDSIKHEQRFAELKHILLEYGSKRYRGLGAEAVAGYNGFMEGASMTLEAIRQTISEIETKQE